MTSTRTLRPIRALLAPVLALALFASGSVHAQTPAAAPAALTYKVYNGDLRSFHVTAVVLSGATESAVIDSGFTRADALRIAADVLDSGKPLKTIFISNADPDFYFGAEVLKGMFPQAQVLTTQAVRDKLQGKMAGKLAFWGPKMGVNAPTKPIVPEVISGNSFTVDGQSVEVRGTTGLLAHRPYLWIPSLRAIAGNIAILGNLHPWTADTQKLAERQAWIVQLDEMLALQPALVIPGHMLAGTKLDTSSITFTRDYLVRWEQELPRAANGAELIQTMNKLYPTTGLAISLEIGAKVNKGEMKW
jgi:glyoxylase-like metal-dependent hydrolase (beta-lactamase superfamily II)